ncbi:hypothetical protein PAP_08325 [Palaeococcus pacificus DY20341]|uniref:Eight-cysteine-cluster domain-containing protein n=1 Tax=Palaeococcus pacificus DY20341 TaxID=1343739 RepID=A0A075LZP5_9EURY|nr:CGP-CTERM-anchored Cys-rich protein [Palaeococcus pacificus]AIF70053.1 hypothetical protein PAP_08325 [Palaeococcus pacificus DY20341]
MRKTALVLILLLMVLPFMSACFSPSDMLAVEVYLNKPGISYNLSMLKGAQNIIVENGTFIYRSHYDERVAVILREDEALHIRIEIPAKSFNSSYAFAEFETSMLIPNDTLRKLNELGWTIEGNYTFKKENLLVQITPQRGSECQSDSDCAAGGCSGEICTTRENAKEIVSICVYREWYDCLRMTNCGCVNGVCTWKPNQDFEKCLREHGVDPEKVIKMPSAAIWVAVYNKEKPSENDLKELETLFSELGISCALKNATFKTQYTNFPVGVVDEYTFNFKEALRVELEWLKENGVVNISEEDINAIVGVAERAKAGYNSHIGWYETKSGKYAWIPYDESKNPKLLKCIGEPMKYELPQGSVVLKDTPTTSSTSTTPTAVPDGVCGPSLILALTLTPALIKRRKR